MGRGYRGSMRGWNEVKDVWNDRTDWSKVSNMDRWMGG